MLLTRDGLGAASLQFGSLVVVLVLVLAGGGLQGLLVGALVLLAVQGQPVVLLGGLGGAAAGVPQARGQGALGKGLGGAGEAGPDGGLVAALDRLRQGLDIDKLLLRLLVTAHECWRVLLSSPAISGGHVARMCFYAC